MSFPAIKICKSPDVFGKIMKGMHKFVKDYHSCVKMDFSAILLYNKNDCF